MFVLKAKSTGAAQTEAASSSLSARLLICGWAKDSRAPGGQGGREMEEEVEEEQ